MSLRMVLGATRRFGGPVNKERVVVMRRRTPIVFATILAFAGCGIQLQKDAEHRFFASADGSVELQFPGGWHENEKDNPYDLQCFSKHEDMNTGVFVYKEKDLATDFTPRDVLQSHIDDLRSKRDHFTILEQQTVTEHDKKTLTTVVYSGDKAASKYYYRITLIEFSENPGLPAVVIQVTFPSDWVQHKPILEDITISARLRLQEP